MHDKFESALGNESARFVGGLRFDGRLTHLKFNRA
jgi:hypothetical protein